MTERSLDSPSAWRLDTFFVPPGALGSRAVALDGAEAHHAVHVVRVVPGDVVRLIDGEGVEAVARIDRVDASRAWASILEVRAHRRTEGVELTLFKAVERAEVEAQLERVRRESYSRNLRILEAKEKVAQPAGAKARTMGIKDAPAKTASKARLSASRAKSATKSRSVVKVSSPTKTAKPAKGAKATKAAKSAKKAKATKKTRTPRATKETKAAKEPRRPKAARTAKARRPTKAAKAKAPTKPATKKGARAKSTKKRATGKKK